MPMRIGHAIALILLGDGTKHLASGGDGIGRGSGILDRCPKHGQEAVAEELVDDAMVPVDDLHQKCERGIEARDNLGRRPLTGCGGEAADVDEHDANAAHLAELGSAKGEQPVDHLGRDMLAEEVGDPVSCRNRR